MPGPSLALCLEQTLGHRAHGLNIEAALREREPSAAIHRIEYSEQGRLRLPWALRGSARALRQWRAVRQRPDVTLFHTSTISLFAPRTRRKYVVSLDATPLQVDAMGQWYAHTPGNEQAERLKRRWYRSVFGRAEALVAWSCWAAESLERDYGIPRERILIAHPGAPAPFFDIARNDASRRKPRILFVGGDFPRKGGDVLLQAFAPLAERAELVLVTDAAVPTTPGVTRLSGIRPGTPALLEAFAAADIFCLPTRGDCTPVALGEAMAAGLPVVTTRVGSNGETVTDREDGVIVRAGNAAELQAALASLVDDCALRRRMGAAARETARERMHAPTNARRIIELLRSAA